MHKAYPGDSVVNESITFIFEKSGEVRGRKRESNFMTILRFFKKMPQHSLVVFKMELNNKCSLCKEQLPS